MITRVPWSGEAEIMLAHPAGAECMPYLKREVLAGVAKLWRCEEGKHSAWIITRVDENPRELVICYAVGTGLHCFAAAFIEAARAAGIPMRVHTTSPFVARYVRRFGFAQAEYVLRAAA